MLEVGPTFASSLARFGDAPALVEGARRWSYAELADGVDRVADRLGERRRLVLVEADNAADAVVAYLGALRGGHAVALAAPGSTSPLAGRLLEAYDPDVVLAGPAVVERRAGTAHDLHPDLALLLSTSGSTGSPKLVRLSHRNLQSNAEAIAAFLGLRADDVAQTTLPLHYCYGLSVLHSHLSVGATVVLTGTSVLDECFWASATTNGVTNLAGVPHTFELLDRAGFAERDLPRLRFLTQAGGRMAPEAVARWARLGEARGWRLFVMYGQTEATARMAYLPPEEAATRPSSIGRAIPGGELRLEDGELVYTGPNVMLGYAEHPSDLARGATLEELRTGDLGRVDADGYFHVVGRRSRFLKVFGLRIALDELEARLGEGARCTGDDAGLVVAVRDPARVAPAARLVRDLTGLPPAAATVVAVEELPRLATGKVDDAAILALRARGDAGSGDLLLRVRRLYAGMLDLPLDDVDPGSSFVELGGDSLTYVELSIRLEALLGALPPDWHRRPLHRLLAAGPPRLPQVETTVVLRALSILAVVVGHATDLPLVGGAHVLLAVTGYNLARFQLAAPSARLRPGLARIVLPSVAWIALVVALTDELRLANVALLTPVVGAPPGQGLWRYWYVEVVAMLLVAVGLLLRWPPFRSLHRRRPAVAGWSVLAAGLLLRSDLFGFLDGAVSRFQPHNLLWLLALGWVAEQARSARQRVAVSLVAALSIHGWFPSATRGWVVLAGMLLLLWVPCLPVPRAILPLLGAIAGASLWIYLTHYQVLDALGAAPAWLAVVASLAAGMAARLVQASCTRRVMARTRAARAASA